MNLSTTRRDYEEAHRQHGPEDRGDDGLGNGVAP